MRELGAREPRKRSRGISAVAIAGLLFSGGVFGSCSSRPKGQVDRVILIGLDGLDWKVLNPLLEAGRLPNLDRLVRTGASGPLETLLPTYSPIIWASMITGKAAREHGIDHFVKAREPGETEGESPSVVPYSSNSRRVRALWDLLGEEGLRVASVGWWTTWPAEAVHGIQVSDRMVRHRFDRWIEGWGAGEDLPHQTYPEDFVEEIRGLSQSREDLVAEVARRFFPEGGMPEIDRNLHDPMFELLLAYGRDSAYLRILDRVLEEEEFDFLAFYLNGIDIASHYLWKYRFPEEWEEPVPEEDVRKFGEVIARYCEFVDQSLGHLLQRAGERSLVIVASDHGFRTGRRADSPNISGTHYRSKPPGVFLCAGGPVSGGEKLEGATIFDIVPTVLHALGLKVARDLPGRVLSPFLRGPDGKLFEPSFCETYETGPVRSEESYAPIPTDLDGDRIRRLQALGYLEVED